MKVYQYTSHFKIQNCTIFDLKNNSISSVFKKGEKLMSKSERVRTHVTSLTLRYVVAHQTVMILGIVGCGCGWGDSVTSSIYTTSISLFITLFSFPFFTYSHKSGWTNSMMIIQFFYMLIYEK